MQKILNNSPFGPEERLACLLSKAHIGEEEKLLAQVLLNNPNFCFKNFEELINFNGVSLLVYPKLSLLGRNVQCEKLKKIQELNTNRRAKFLQLLSDFNTQNIPVYILKGFMLGELVYNNYSYKRMNDIDIIIPKSYIHDALIIFNSHNFNFPSENLLGKKAIDFRLHHSPPLIHQESNTIIGLHWGLLSPLAKRHPTTDIFYGQKTLKIGNFYAQLLSFEHNLLHLCIHLPFFKIGLRELSDVANLALFGSEQINWPFFFETAEKWRALDAVYRVFSLSDALIPWCNSYVQAKLNKIQQQLKHSLYIKDTNLRLKNPGLLIRSRSTYVAQIEKHFILFRLSKNYPDKKFHLKEQWRLFFNIPDQEKARLNIKSSNLDNVTYKSSRLLWFSLAQDLGHYYLSLVTLSNLLSLLKSRIKNIFLKTDSSDPNIALFRRFMEHIE